jgi:uncharacterized repeat protein (TIGR01451 family)
MKRLKQQLRKNARTLLPKFFSGFLIVVLVFQPVGGALGVLAVQYAVADDAVSTTDATTVPTIEVAPGIEAPVVSDDAGTKTPLPVEEKTIPQISADTTGAEIKTDSAINEKEPAVETTPAPTVETPAVTEDVKAPLDAPTQPTLEVAVPQAPLQNVVENTDVPAVSETSQTENGFPVTVSDTKVCLAKNFSEQSSKESDWTVDANHHSVTTNEKVKLGVRYVFPLNKEVSLIFTCLPEKESDRSALHIEQMNASDINLPAGVSAASDFAYDIKTDGMTNGSFAYDLSLPKTAGVDNVSVSYIEKSTEEVKGKVLNDADFKAVDGKDTTNKEKSVVVSDIDHFTILIATHKSETYTPVRICHATGSEHNPYNSITPNTAGILMGHSGASHQDGRDIIPPVPGYLPLGQNWNANGQSIWNNDCEKVKTGKVKFTKVVSGGTAVPSDWSFALSGVSGTFHSGDSTTLPVGTYTVTESGPANYTATDVSGVCGNLSGASATLTVTENRGTCTFTNTRDTGNLKVVKVVDDGSALTQWSFALDGGQAIQANTGGQVDFGQVTTAATHIITESGPTTAYQLVSVSGTHCARVNHTLSGNATVVKGGTTVCTFSNAVNKGSITIIKNAVPNDAQDFSFATTGDGLMGFHLDDDNKSALPNTKFFQRLLPGNYSVTEASTNGWNLTSIACTSDNSSFGGDTSTGTVNIVLTPGKNVTCTFTNTKLGEIELVKKTVGGDGSFEYNLTGQGLPETTTIETLNGQGSQTFTNIDPNNTYSIAENVPTGWNLDSAVCVADTQKHDDEHHTVLTPDSIKVKPGGHITCTFTNTKLGHIVVDKVTNPTGADQSFDFALSGASEFQQNFSLTDMAIPYDSGAILPGTYSVSEKELAGWKLDSASCEGQAQQEDVVINSLNPSEIVVHPGESIHCTFTNQFVQPVLEIHKSNNSVAPQSPGDEVNYTITVTAPKDNLTPVEDVKVTDLPPAGFVYISGSAVASQGGLTHTYASPGVWSLGTIDPGDTVTLHYAVKISGSQDAGTYGDTAFANGKSLVAADVLANESEATPFVGTAVEVMLPAKPVAVVLPTIVESQVKHRTVHKVKRVLGATLPETGTPTYWTVLALTLLASGLMLMLWTTRRRMKAFITLKFPKMLPKIFLGLVMGVCATVAGTSSAQAASSVSVQIETPQAQVSAPQFAIGFVALDIQGRPVSVECFKKGPSDGGFTSFATYPLIDGGSSGNCNVQAIVMPTDGVYQFRVVASASGSESATSNTVNVTLLSANKPGVPSGYVRSAVSSCINQISFTSADDGGKTVKVELYRSLANTFVADASTKVQELALASHQNGTMTDTVSDCTAKYFYAVRAVSVTGDTSDFVGDVTVTVDKQTKTRVKTTTKNRAPTQVAGAIAVAPGAGAENTETVSSETPSVEGATSENAAQGSDAKVLGENADFAQTTPMSLFAKFGTGATVIGVLLLILWYVSIKRKHQK